MKSFLRGFVPVVLLVVLVAATRAELAHIEAKSPLEAVFFKLVTVGPASVAAPRPPSETRPELATRIAASPGDGDLYSLRALEDERQLDAVAAESDWTRYAQLARDGFAGQIALADFYHRRLQPAKELAALSAASVLPAPSVEHVTPAPEQRAWKTFERAVALVDDQLLGFDAARNVLRAWIARYPAEPAAYSRYLDYAVAHKQFDDAGQVSKLYAAAFPNDAVFPVRAQAQVEAARGSAQSALALYDRAFRPLWPPELVKSYFELLKTTGSLRRFLQDARAKSGELDGTARIFYYWQQQGNLANAQRALVEFESRKVAHNDPWNADQLWTLTQLYETANNPDRAARCYYGLYSLAGVTAADAERALAGIANLLFTYSDQGIRFGSGDLSYYRDIAQADPYPGYLNGILSLILNTTGPSYNYSQQNQLAQPYFRRARAAELVALFDSRFPASPRRAALRASLINAYSVYGDNQAVIKAGMQFRAQFADASQRTEVATLMADAYARTNQVQPEFALYNELLQELARRADGVPLGEHAGVPAAANAQTDAAAKPAPSPRSPEYARILDRYIARLVALKRIPDALALYRRELDRNRTDPGLYERFAAFLEQNRLGADVEATYKRAMAQFPDSGWSHKLARWYLRRKQTAQFTALTRDVVSRFSGTDLEAYFSEAVPHGSVAAALYLQLNLYAHQRFPHDLAFTRNLLTAYSERATADAAAYESLLRANWFYDDDLRTRFFEYLSRTKKLDAELAALGSINQPRQVNVNPVAARMLADGEAWRTHYEAAAPVYRAITVSYPAEASTAGRAAAIYRSLATIDPAQTDVASGIEQNLVNFAPANTAALTYAGEIWADRDRFDRARPLWQRIAAVAPGRADGYLESATVFWDYFLFDDALSTIASGRKNLQNPSLFAYEAGAIYENKRQYDRALAEYASAALDQSSDTAQRRLVRLARRPALRDNVERLTAGIASRPDPSPRALALRAAILENQGRRADLEQLLTGAAGRSNSVDTLEWIQNQGRTGGFAKVQESAMLRRVAITTDPVDQVRYQLAVVHFYEDQARTADAQRILAALVQAHPTTLGVVRAVTDFYWRTGQQKRAVETLADAANRAQPSYQTAFRLEAARKSTDAGDTATARQLLGLLLKGDPYRSEYLAAMADTYARAGDDRGLRTFYQSTIEGLRASALSNAGKIERTAAMRRGLIPVLTRVKDYDAALDQYVEILNRYPEDEQMAREAAAYAGAHSSGDRLMGIYTKTAAAAPRDSRWPVVLARVATELEHFPEAVDAYSKAIAIRPDRADLLMAQAKLQERLLRFADAERNYAKLYELTYHDASWMERIATVRARQGQKDGMIAALRTAFIENRPERADNFFAVATRLNNWGYVAEARQFAEKGADVAGQDLITESDLAHEYARVMGRARQHEAVYRRLAANGTDPDKAPSLSSTLRLLGRAARDYYTPEEKAALAAFLEKQRTPDSRVGLEAVEAAGLEDVTVRWLSALLRATPSDAGLQNQVAEHQRRRMLYRELGIQFEQLYRASPPEAENREALLAQAAMAYQQDGSAAAELRVLRMRPLDAQVSARICRLLTEQPQALMNLAGAGGDDVRDMAANCAIEYGKPADALASIGSRGKGLPPVWTSAYTGLTGLYFAVLTPQVRDAFLDALGSPVIGDRIGKPGDRNRHLAGNPWFYYGSRFGEYLALSKQPEAADYLPAMLEASPGNAAAYSDSADYYRDAGDSQRAMVDYAHSLELDPRRAIVHDRMAELLWSAGRQEDAIAEWRRALESFYQQQDRGSVQAAFTEEVKTTLTHIGHHGVLASVQTEAERLLKTWLRRNGTYMFDPLLEGLLAASGDPGRGVAWLVALSQSNGDPLSVLEHAVRNPALADAQRDVLYQKLIDSYHAKMAGSFGQPRETAEQSLRTWQREWLESLVSRRETARAQQLLDSIPASARKSFEGNLVPIELRIAAQSGAVPAVLARYAADREPPPLDALQRGANELKRANQDAAARLVSEFIFTRELEAHHFDAANFLGLAEIRLQDGQTPAAIALLRRMTMLAGEPFETEPSAAALLARFGRDTEAAAFWEQRVKAVPWDAQARGQLAALRKNVRDLATVASDANAPYAVRADAAVALRRNGGTTLATAPELNLLAASTPFTEAAVNKPYWHRARIEAAASIADLAAKIRILQAAVAAVPEPPGPRLELFRTAMAAKRYQLAIAAMPSPEAQGYEASSDTGTFLEWQVSSFLQNAGYADADRAAIARGLGEAYQRLNERPRAVYYYRLALELDKSPAARASIQPALDALRRSVEWKRANDLRRPAVSANLEQPRLVRPRLTGGGGQ